eukprot:COSAG04_NODE_10639_length_762_cov_0.702866_2_plen_29_part_01
MRQCCARERPRNPGRDTEMARARLLALLP